MNIYCQLEFCPFLQETGCQLHTIHRLQGFKLIQKPEVLNLKLCLNSQDYSFKFECDYSFKFECDLLPGYFMELRQNKFYLLDGLVHVGGNITSEIFEQSAFFHPFSHLRGIYCGLYRREFKR